MKGGSPMHVRERIRAIKLLDQLSVHPEMAERLGLSFSCKYLLCEDGSTNLPESSRCDMRASVRCVGLKDKEKMLYV